jgi:hypothetical protein
MSFDRFRWRVLIPVWIFFLSAWNPVNAWQDGAILYSAPPGIEPSKDFRVQVDGRDCFVYACDTASFVIFSFSGEADISVFPSHDVRRVDIRPLSAGIRHTIRDNAIRFRIDRPANLSVELNNEITNPLYLFANPLESDAPGAADSTVRFFKSGMIHEPGEIRLKSGETVYIEGGAVVRGHIVAENAAGLRILGRGILDGGPVPVRHPGSDSVSFTHTRRRMIDLLRCADVLIDGITILNSATWTVVPQFCSNVRIRNLKEVCWRNGSDGVDVVGSSNVIIDGCFMRNNDDCITLKTWGGSEKYPRQAQKGPDVTGVQILNSVFWNMAWGNALEIGFELRSDRISDILFKNCDVIHVERGATFSIHNGDYASVENIRYEDIRVEDSRHKLIDLAVFLSQYSADRPTDAEERRRRYMNGAWDGVLKVAPEQMAATGRNRGHIRNITFKNIQVVDGPFPFSILSGFDAGHRVENVLIENLTFFGKKIHNAEEGKFSIQNAGGVQFK